MITTDELKVQLAEYNHAVKDLEEALAISAASRKRVQELETLPLSALAFIDDAELSKKCLMRWAILEGQTGPL